jgi:heptosyltransferase-2
VKLLLWVFLPTRLAIWLRQLRCTHGTPGSPAPTSFILFRLDALGDLVLTTPVFRELRRAHPDAHIAAVVQHAYRSILEANPYIDELLSVSAVRPAARLREARYLLGVLMFYWRKLRGRRFDVAICPRWDTDEHLATLLCTLTFAKLRIGFSENTSAGKRRFNRGFDSAFDICLNPGPLRHEVERNLAIVEALGPTVADDRTEIALSTEDREHASRMLEDVPEDCVLVVLGIGAQSPGRRWPLERYSALIHELSRDFPVHTVITCAPSDHESASSLARTLPGRATISDNAAIRETCALLERCDLFIGNDTGAAHLSAAMECPTIVVSRHPADGDPGHPNSPARFHPWSVAGAVLQPDHGIGGCDKRCREISRPHCILQISVPRVVATAKALLGQSSRVRDKLVTSHML